MCLRAWTSVHFMSVVRCNIKAWAEVLWKSQKNRKGDGGPSLYVQGLPYNIGVREEYLRRRYPRCVKRNKVLEDKKFASFFHIVS